MSLVSKKRKQKSFKSTSSSIFNAKKVSDVGLALRALQLEYSINYGINLRDRIITITGDIEEPLFDFVDAALSEMEHDSKKAVTIRIHSGGGSVYEALAVIGRIRSAKVSKITTEGYGQIMSAATMLLACGHERKINKYAYFMHHEASYGMDGRLSEHKDLLKQVEKEEDDWAIWMAEFSEKTKKFWKESGCRKDAYFSPDELVKLGVADEVFGK